MIDINASREFSLLRLKFVINKLSAWRNQIAFEHGEFWNSLKICLFWLWLLHARTHTYTFVEGRYSRMYKKEKIKKRREVGDESKEPSHYVACLPIPSFPAFLHDSLRALPYLALLLSKSTHACMHACMIFLEHRVSLPPSDRAGVHWISSNDFGLFFVSSSSSWVERARASDQCPLTHVPDSDLHYLSNMKTDPALLHASV